MNSIERDEIRDLRDYLNKRFMWAAGLIIGMAVAAIGWEFQQTQTLSTTSQVAQDAQAAARTNTADIKQIGRDISSSNEQISGMAAQIAALARTLTRIDNSLSELTRYIRDERSQR